jgi:hypothetical protein
MTKSYSSIIQSRWWAMTALAAATVICGSAQTININCGGGAYTAADGSSWVGDQDFSGGDLLYTGDSIANTSDLPIYRSGRAGLYGDFSYTIPVPNGSYTVNFKFAEIQYWNPGDRVFNVVLNGSPVLTNFDILAHVAPRTAFDQQFPVTVTNGAIQIAVNGVVRRGLVNGIQITPSGGAAPTAPVLSLSTSSAGFGATAGAGSPGAQVINITNSGSGTMAWTASANQSWLSVTPASGTGSGALSIQPNTSGLAAGTYTGTVTVSAPGASGSPKTIAVTVVVAAAAGGSSVVNINCGGGAYTGVDGTNWSGDQYFSDGDLMYTSDMIQNTRDLALYRSARAGLYGDFTYSIPVANGTYNVNLLFAEIQYWSRGDRVFNVSINGTPALSNFDILAQVASRTAMSQTFPVTVTNGLVQIAVTGVVNRGIVNGIQIVPTAGGVPVTPTLSLSSGSLSFNGTAGSSNPAAQTVGVSNAGGGTLNWTASSNQTWLTVSPASGSGAGTVSIQPNLSGLAAGSYSATITVAAAGASGSPKTIAVSLTVGSTPAALTVSSTALSFSGTAGSSNPAAQTVNISNSGGGTLTWTASSNQSWLTASPTSGSGSGTLSIQPNISGLAAGSYSATVTVTASGASGSPKTIGVSLSLTAAPAPTVTMTVAPTLMNFSVTSGSNPSAQSFSISDSGGTAAWTATKTQPWLTLSPASGGGPMSVTVNAAAASLAVGTYTDTIIVTGSGVSGGPTSINVTLNVAAGAAPPPSGPPPSGTGNNWYVTTSGSPGGDGSMGNPWDIVTALAGPSAVKPGDTIWLRAGRYGGGQYNSQINSSLVGTPSEPIIVRAYPGERVTIDAWLQVGCCDQANNPAAGSYTWFWGLEFASYNTNRTSGTSGPPQWAFQYNHGATDTWGAGTKFINCIVHDTAGGISVWNADNSEVNGNIVFNIGGYGTDRGHGHDFYVQNVAPAVLNLNDNIGFNNFDMGLQAYGSSGAYVQNIHLKGNIIFNSGVLYGQLVDNLTLGGGTGGPSGILLDSNYFYDTPSKNQGYNELGYLWTPIANDAVATNNYFIGGNQAIDLERWNTLTFQNNTIYSTSQESMLIYGTSQNPSTYNHGNNTYYGSGVFQVDPQCNNWPCGSSQTVNFSTWKALTGLDNGSTFTPGAPTGVWTAVRPNAYDAGRANIVIFNWPLNSSVPVDLSPSGIRVGDQYQIRDAENWYNGPVVSGTYTGAPVNVPMTGLTVVQPFGSVPYPASHTAPQFGVFVLLSGTALTNTY